MLLLLFHVSFGKCLCFGDMSGVFSISHDMYVFLLILMRPAVLTVRTCTEWGDLGLTTSTMADIDPDGAAGDLEPTRVFCDMTSEGGVGVTVIGMLF